MAECVLKYMVAERGLENEFIIDSAGTSDEEAGNAVYPPARRKLQQKGIEVVEHRAKQLKRSDYEKFDLFLCAEERNVSAAKAVFGGDKQNKVRRMLDFSLNPRNIADPWWTGDFEEAYNDIYEACASVIDFAKENGYINATV